MRTYKTNKPFLLTVSGTKNPLQFAKDQVMCVVGDKLHVQGRVKPLNLEILVELIESGKVDEVNGLDENYLRDNVLPHPEMIRLKKIISKAKKKLKPYLSVIETIETWTFQPKGSKAVNIKTEMEFQKNPKEVLSKTILGEGMKAKPGCYVMNRGLTRNGVFVTTEDETSWLNDISTLLPYGIRQSDYASQSTQVKIFQKLINQTISMEDCPDTFREFFERELGITKDVEPLRDFLRYVDPKTMKDHGFPKLFFSDFSKNQHHSKEKGLEFCHLDPTKEFATSVDNITIGSSRSNRIQGGYSIEYMKMIFG